eukprot:6194682-Pleurochrysis_carterae.AAC.3
MRPVEYTAPQFYEGCLNSGLSGMRSVRPRLYQHRSNVTVEPWRNKIVNEAAKKLKKLKQAHTGFTIKLSRVTPSVFQGIHDLQPTDGGRHLTPYNQVAGTRGGDKKEYAFDV